MTAREARAQQEAPQALHSGDGAPEFDSTWPHDLPHEPTMRISDVLGALSVEFPAVTPSKLRFWEERGLVAPQRTPAGYRMYSVADVERLRFVLVEQRDHYRPLRVIKDELDDLDRAGGQVSTPRLVASDGLTTADGRLVDVAELARRAEVDEDLCAELVAVGALRTVRAGKVDVRDVPVAQACARLVSYGLDPRHIKALRATVGRQVDLVGRALAAGVRRDERGLPAAGDAATEVADALAVAATAWVRHELVDPLDADQ